MMSLGYDPASASQSLKPPIYQTSTFGFTTAEEGKQFFQDSMAGRGGGLIYTRLDNPNLQMFEKRLALLDEKEDSLLFASGMAAIATVFMDKLKHGDVLLYSEPCYGGTHHLIKHYLEELGVRSFGYSNDMSKTDILKMLRDQDALSGLKHIHLETPINPTCGLFDIKMVSEFAEERFRESGTEITTSIDNTFLGPVFQKPARLGVDYIIYSATKYLGGHSDIIAGAVSCNENLSQSLRKRRGYFGNMGNPHDAWLLCRSLETLDIRMHHQQQNAKKLAQHLYDHPKDLDVNYLGLDNLSDIESQLFQSQCVGAGAMLSFTIPNAGEQEAFKFLNALELVKLAVSLGSTESLAQHPHTMTHANVSAAEKERLGISPAMIRISVGLENISDLIADIDLALAQI